MAAPLGSTKLSKSERKHLKKQNRARLKLINSDGIHAVDTVTLHLVVFNGGLGNNVSHSELEGVFSPFGNIADIVMLPEKSYAFVSYHNLTSAQEAYTVLNGRLMKYPEEVSLPGIHFYLAFVETVPVLDLNSHSLPPGLTVLENFINEEYEEKLLTSLDWQTVDPNLRPGCKVNLKHRRVKHFGYEFMYGINNVDLARPLKNSIPPSCSQIIDKLLSDGIIKDEPDQLTVNQYEPGQGIPPHVDTHSAFEDWIISLSLGSQVVMEFRHPDGHEIPVVLPRRSLVIMTGEARYVWTHGITPRKSDVVPIRYANSSFNEMSIDGIAQSAVPHILSASDDNEMTAMKPLNKIAEVHLTEKDNGSKARNVDGDQCGGRPVISDTGNKNQENLVGIDTSEIEDMQSASGLSKTSEGIECQGLTSTRTKHDYREKSGLSLVKRSTRTSFTFRKVLVGPCKCAFPEYCDSQQENLKKSDKPSGNIPNSNKEAMEVEQQHVHQVYEEIASHFSATRHTPWPHVVKFLSKLPAGSLIADIGCGNGKYLSCNSSTFKLGCDRSYNLCSICHERGFPVFVSDCLSVPIRANSFDAAISIAVIHHLSTMERRIQAVQELVKILRPGGHALIYVWALEQERYKEKSNYLQDSRIRGKENLKVKEESRLGMSLDSGKSNQIAISDQAENRLEQSDQDIQDILWTMTPTDNLKTERPGSEDQLEAVESPGLSPVHQSSGSSVGVKSDFKHCDLSEKSPGNPSLDTTEFEGQKCEKDVHICDPRLKTEVEGLEKATSTPPQQELGDPENKKLTVHVNRTHFESQDLLVPWHLKGKTGKPDCCNVSLKNPEPVFHRYYHVFQEGELEELCSKVPNVQVVEGYYDKGNWCVILQKT